MCRLALLAAVCLFAAAAPAEEPVDPVKAKHEKAISKARAAYQDELEKFDAAATKHFDAAEAAARKKGDKTAVDTIKRERLACGLLGAVPKSAPATLGQKVTTASAALTGAYETAVKEYTKARKDDLAGEAQKKLTALKKDGGRFFLLVNRQTGRIAAAEKEDGARGSPLVQTEHAGKPNQHWSFVATADPLVFHVRNRASGHFFNIGGTVKDKTPLILWDGGGGTHNTFIAARTGAHYTFMNTDSKKFVCGAPEADKWVVNQQEKPADEEHLWSLVPLVP